MYILMDVCVFVIDRPGMLELWNLLFRHICAMLWLICDWLVVSIGGNRSTRRKTPPNLSHWQLSHMPRSVFEPMQW